jgi:hypothetical protein
MITPIRIILTDDGGTVRSWPTTPTRIVDEPSRMPAGKMALTIENLKDESELTLYLNGETIPRIERGGWPSYPVFPTDRVNCSRIEIPLSHLALVRGQNMLGISLQSTRPTSEAWVHVREVELLVGDV